MAEREVFNPETGQYEMRYDDGIYETNPYVPPPAYTPAPTAPAPTTPTTAPPPTTTGGGKTPQQIEAEGREYDRKNGLIGGWFDSQRNIWVNGSPGVQGTPEPTDGGDPYAVGPEPTEAAFNWTQFTPSRLDLPMFTSKIGPYQPVSMAEAERDPGYLFSRDQGRKTLESSAAGRGVLRTGGTLKDILAFGDQFGQQNYQAVDNRKFRNWGANVDNEFRTYGTNRDTATTMFDRNYRGEHDSFNARRESEKLTFADMYSRWRDRLNSLTNIATAGMNS